MSEAINNTEERKEPVQKIFLTSDHHFGHENIIRYTGRPFKDIYEMDECLIENWNKTVSKRDLVYHVGDIFVCSKRLFRNPSQHAENIRRRLNGQIFLIKGNHEAVASDLPHLFGWVRDYYKLKVTDPDTDRGTQEIVLFHYPIEVWDKSHHGAWHCCGHSHNSFHRTRHCDPTDSGKRLDVGIDSAAFYLGKGELLPENYRPLSYDEVKSIMAKKKFKSCDHHGAEE